MKKKKNLIIIVKHNQFINNKNYQLLKLNKDHYH
jgi:hypothetical protein